MHCSNKFKRPLTTFTFFWYHETPTYYFSTIYQIKYPQNTHVFKYGSRIFNFLLDFWIFIHLIFQIRFCHCSQSIFGNSLTFFIIYSIFLLYHIPPINNAQVVRYFNILHFYLFIHMAYIHIYGKYFDLERQFEYTYIHYIATMWHNTYLVFKNAYCELENNAYSTYVIHDIPNTHFTTCFLYANLLANIIGSGLSLNIYIFPFL